jgi:preprotein translocase subunit SecG
MQTVIIVIHLMVIVALVAVVLLQRSEGGALGMGGSDQFMTMRGQGNVLTRAAAILGAIFFATSLAMSVLNRLTVPPTSILDTTPAAQTAPTAPANGAPATAPADTGKGILDQLNKYTSGPPGTVTPKSVVPDTGTPPAPTGSQPATGGVQTPAPATGSQPAPAGSQPAPTGSPAPAQ